MTRLMLRSKIHRATVTSTDLHYEGSISIGPELLKAADILPWEQVQVVDVNNGERFVTYAIEGQPKQIQINGAAARLASPGDLVIIMSFSPVEEDVARSHSPIVVSVDLANRILEPAYTA